MGKGSVTWEPCGSNQAIVKFWKVVPQNKVETLVRGLQELGCDLSDELPPVPARIAKSRSFGKLPPGVYPYWQRREWSHFILWLVIVGAIFAAAIWRHVKPSSHVYPTTATQTWRS